MKYWAYLLILTIISCNNQPSKNTVSNSDSSAKSPGNTSTETNNEICWAGTLNGKVPVFIHYQLDGNLVAGEIKYLSTKEQLPITLLGTIENDKSYRLLEFDNTGNITGIIIGTPKDKKFDGTWVSPKTGKKLAMALLSKDTSVARPNIQASKDEIFGDYHYQYGEEGYNGDFSIAKVDDNKAAFNILSVTSMSSGANIAEVEKDTIAMTGTNFIYKIPESDSCEFKVSFYKNFVYINYTRGYCAGQFGLNASIDGVFLKTK